jgi:hypothetical protein
MNNVAMIGVLVEEWGNVDGTSLFVFCVALYLETKEEPGRSSLYSEWPWFVFPQCKILFSTALGLTQPPIQLVPGSLSPGIKQQDP